MWFPQALDSRRSKSSRRLSVEALDDRCVPATLSIGDATIVEGDSGTQTAYLAVTLSGPINPPVTVDYSTANVSAVAGSDYRAVSGTVTFRKGETYKTIAVPVIGDLTAEPTETFNVNLRNAKHVTIADGQGVVTITDNDTRLRIDDVTAAEGQAGTTPFTFHVTLSPARNVPVTVDWATGDYTAEAGSDYAGGSGRVTFAPGETSKPVTVNVNGERHFESDEMFVVNLSNPTNAVIDKGYGWGTIVNDDVLINISGGSVTEGNDGTAAVTFTVTLSGQSDGTVTVDYATADNTATAGSDYASAGGTLTFAPGQTSQTFTVNVNGDSTLEYDEYFLVNLSNANGADVGAASAWGSILNDDGPIVSIDDVWQYEGSYGSTTVYAFTVHLSMPSSGTVEVDYTTMDGWAVAGEDYEAASGTLTFAPGETDQTIYVTVFGDDYYEGDENFSVVLSLRSGTALVQPGGGNGWIGDDDYYDGGWYYDPGYYW